MNVVEPAEGNREAIQIDDLRVAFRRAGAGPPLVLIHGMPGDSRVWRREIEDLSDAFTVVAWDMPGSGDSSDPPEGFTLRDFADTLGTFIDRLQLGRPHVCGLSFGSGLALALYQQRPDIPRSLVLAGAYAGWAGSLPPDVVRERLDRVLADADLPPDHLVRSLVPTFFTTSVSPDVVEEIGHIVSEFHPVGVKVALRAFAEADLREILPTIDVPTLLLHGDRDVRSPLHVAEDLHTAIPGSELVIFPGVGHVSNMEAPQRFGAEVRRFLLSVEAF